MAKMKINNFFVNAEFYRVVWTINALLTVLSEMLRFSGNNQNIKIFRVPPNTLPSRLMYILIICYWAILHYTMSFKTIAGRSDGVFWWFSALSEDQEKICRIHPNYLVALIWPNHIKTNSIISFLEKHDKHLVSYNCKIQGVYYFVLHWCRMILIHLGDVDSNCIINLASWTDKID